MDKTSKNHAEKILTYKMPVLSIPDRVREYGIWGLASVMYASTPGAPHAWRDYFDHCPRRRFEYYSLSHMHDGYGRLWLESGLETDIRPGDLVLMAPGDIHRYGGYGGKDYIEDTFCFAGPVADCMRRAKVITTGVYHVGRLRLLRPLQEYLMNPSVESQLRGSMELQKLLMNLYLNRGKAPSRKQRIFEEIVNNLKMYPEKWWTVGELAEMSNMEPASLRRLFQEKTGMTPKIYMDRYKIFQAGARISGTACSVAQVARDFGYRDPYHFSRRFKYVMGMSPMQYRHYRGNMPQVKAAENGREVLE